MPTPKERAQPLLQYCLLTADPVWPSNFKNPQDLGSKPHSASNALGDLGPVTLSLTCLKVSEKKGSEIYVVCSKEIKVIH